MESRPSHGAKAPKRRRYALYQEGGGQERIMESRPGHGAAAPRVVDAVSFALLAVAELQKTAESLAKSLAKSPGGPEPFLTTLCPLLSDVEVRLQGRHRARNPSDRRFDSEKRVFKLLVVLETLWPGVLEPAPDPPFKRESYPYLDRLLKGSQQTAKNNLRRLAKSSYERAPAEREKFQRSFRAFANVERQPRGPPLSELVTDNTSHKSSEYDEYTACLRLLHKTLHQCSFPNSGCCGSFVANLALSRVQRVEGGGGGGKDVVPFDFFFLHRHPDSVDNMWKEVRIRVLLQGDPDSGRSSKVQWFSDRRISPEAFCDLIRHPQRGRLVLSAVTDGLVFEKAELNFGQLERLFLLKSSSVSLAMVLEKRKLQRDVQLKLLLSYLLAKAVWQFYDSDWMSSQWTKDSIHFMRERVNGSSEGSEIITLIHKPYFATKLQPPTSTAACTFGHSNRSADKGEFLERFPTATHCHPKILALGIMLLEIELGEGIERYRTEEFLGDNEPIENDDHYTAGIIIMSPMWVKRNTYQAVKEIIEICLKPDIGKLGVEEAGVRQNIYTHIMAPLGRLFRQAWSHNEDPESFSPDPIHFKSTDFPSENLESLSSSLANNDNLEPAQILALGQPTKPNSSFQAVSSSFRGRPEADTEVSSSDEGELLDDEDAENTVEARRRNTDKWFSKFQMLLAKHRILGRGRDERIKVAILDSGIDKKYPGFGDEDCDRIKEVVTFIGGDAAVDTVGHGTHMAAIILRLTKNVDLYIGKITNTSRVTRREAIAEGLKYARTTWGVHIISLSFGFDSVQSSDSMGDEIRQCLHDGIMVFASASNDGGEGSRTYPAKYPEVICAHTATWRGNKSELNPGREEDRNFSFVGEHVRPIWPAKAPKDETKIDYKSGTSYATPVAVSVAAFMIGYIRKKMPDFAWVIKPWSPRGMLAIFRMMAVNIDGYDWVSPTRYLKYTKEAKIIGDLQQHLG